jgi:hypothetical protein
MRKDIATLADTYIVKPKGSTVFVMDGNTNDIITAILKKDKGNEQDTRMFAHFMKGKNERETCKNIHTFIRTHIRYVEDPAGVQYIKSPSATWKDRYSDCKGYSIFTASLLKNLDIPFRYRFVSYGAPVVTHVYVVTDSGIKIDACLPEFDYEKPYHFKEDQKPMTKIYDISGTGRTVKAIRYPRIVKRRPVDLRLNPDMSEGHADLEIVRNRYEIEKEVVAGILGVNCAKCESYQNRIDAIEEAIEAIEGSDDPETEIGYIIDDIESGVYAQHAKEIAGIGDIGKRKQAREQKKQERKQARQQKKAQGKKPLAKATKKTTQFLKQTAKKAGKTAGKAFKGAAKIVTAPARLALKGLLEITLPKAAPYFLYLFINDPKVLEKMPPKVIAKRRKQERLANFVVNTIGMKRSHFMGILRNGIIRRYGKSPEAVIAEALQKGRLSGIGTVPVSAVLPAVMELLKLIRQIFGKKANKEDVPTEADMPLVEFDTQGNAEDFNELDKEEKQSLPRQIRNQDENFSVKTEVDELTSPPQKSETADEQEVDVSGGRTKGSSWIS